MSLPVGASAILDLRRKGQKPADPVVVCLSGYITDLANPQVFPTGPDDDWSFMKDLEAIVYTSPEARYLRPTLKALARYAKAIDLWDGSRGATVWPVWHGVHRAEVEGFHAIGRESARFKRWGVLKWLPSENRRFMCA